MECLSSSSFDPSSAQIEEIFQTPYGHHSTQTLQSERDQIIPTVPHQDDHHDLDHLLSQIPHFSEKDHHHHHSQRRKASSRVLDHPPHQDSNEKKKQRIIHREVERQRRLEMSSLHTSLRTLLPLDFIKGKRSMSDHLDVTVKYIKHLEHKIQMLNEERDALKLEGCNSSNKYEVIASPWNNNGGLEVTVSINGSSDGDVHHQELPLSRILHCLTKQGLDVVSCISNRLTNKLVHSIQAQVGDGRSSSIDPVELQRKLLNILS